MRTSNRIKLGARAAEMVALMLAAACGSAGAGGSTNSVSPAEGGAPPVDGSSSIDAGSSCVVGCDESEGGSSVEAGDTEAGGTGFTGDPSAVFVATTGADTAPGTMAKPVLTIGKGIALAQAAHKDLYVCDGTYAENVVIDTKPVNVHGGYDCTKGWAKVDDKPTIAPPSGVPLTVTGVSVSMTIEGLQLQAADASTDGASSIAAIASSCPDLAFNRVVFQAGAGASGAQGTSPQTNTTPARTGVGGSSVPGPLCPQGDKSGACGQIAFGGFVFGAPAGCNTVGGNGGSGANLEINYAGSKPAAGSGGAGQDPDGNGLDGLNGGDGKDGTTATSGMGTFNATGYVASNGGSNGTDAQPGASGGGGVGGPSDYANIEGFTGCTYIYIGAGGGMGGWGGCGGTGGGGGGGGGASIGLLAFESTVTVAGCQVNTSAGGDGGTPGKGAYGQLGGAGGGGGIGNSGGGSSACFNSGPLSSGRNGGMGGRGGRGGNGGAGGGGPSLGIVVVGAQQPDTTTVDFNIGTGGQGGQALSGPNAPGGQSTQVLVLGAGGADGGGG